MIKLLLNPDVYYERGKLKDICYSLYDGRTYFFDEKYRNVVHHLLEGINKNELTEIEDEVIEFFQGNGLGIKEEYSGFSEKFKFPKVDFFKSSFFDVREFEKLKKLVIKTCMIQLTGKCNYECDYCEENNFIPCSCYKNSNADINWEDVIIQLKDLGVERINIIGGEPYLEKEKLMDIMVLSKKLNILLVINTNGILINEKDIINIKNNNCKLYLFLPTLNQQNLNKVSKLKDATTIFLKNIRLLEKYNIDYQIISITSLLTFKEDRDILDNKDINQNKILYKNDLPPSKYALNFNGYIDYTIDNIKVDYSNFEFLKNFNPCLRNSIFIDSKGDIKLCQKLDSTIIGNVKNLIYTSLMSDDIYELWIKNNYEDKKCSYCSKKLMCINCKAQFLDTGINYRCLREE